MKPSTLLVLLGVGGVGYWLWTRQRAASSSSTGTTGVARNWRDEDLPEALRALPPAERKVAGDAYYGGDPEQISRVARSLHDKGYHDAAGQLDLRAILVSASLPDATGAEGRLPASSRA